EVSSSAATSVAGQSVRFVADVNPSDGGGTVTFDSDGTAIPGCSNVSFQAGGGTEWLTDCSTSSLSAGTHRITATYSGDATYTGSSGSTTETVQQATTTSLSAAPSSVPIAGTDKLVATVASSDGGGAITFSQGHAVLSGCGAVPLTAAAGGVDQAVCKTSWSAPGSYTIMATYSGDSASASSSGTTTVTVKLAPVVSSVSPNAGSTVGGQTVTITGSNLSGATKVNFGSALANNVTVVSASQLTAT